MPATYELLCHAIARRGHERARRNNHYNEPMLAAVVERAVRPFEGRQ